MSLSTESILLLITTVAVATVAVGIITGVSGQLSETIEFINQEKTVIAKSDISITSDLGSDEVYNETTNELKLLVRNTGSRRLKLSRVNLYINDQVQPINNITVINPNSTVWSPEDVVRINTTANLASGRNTIIVEKFGTTDDVIIYV